MLSDFIDIKDSFISAYNYDKNLNILTLIFSNGVKTPIKYTAYQYIGIPPQLIKELSTADHPGLLFRTKIKPVYPSRRLDPVEYKYIKSAT